MINLNWTLNTSQDSESVTIVCLITRTVYQNHIEIFNIKSNIAVL